MWTAAFGCPAAQMLGHSKFDAVRFEGLRKLRNENGAGDAKERNYQVSLDSKA